MKNKLFVLLASLAIVLGWAMSASAGTVTIKFSNASPHDGTYSGWDSLTGQSENAYAGVYEGYVGSTATDFVCDDFLRNISNGNSWSANEYGSNPVSAGVKFSPSQITNPDLTGLGLSQQAEYAMIGWLVGQILADPTNSLNDWSSLNGAIWSITDGAWANNGFDYAHGIEDSNYTTAVGTYSAKQDVTRALAHKNDTSPDYPVYTPDPTNAGQEFFGPVPEAGTPLLLGFAFLGGSFLRRKLLA